MENQRSHRDTTFYLSNGDVTLIPVSPSHHEMLYGYCQVDPRSFEWRFLGASPNYERFVAHVGGDVLLQLVAMDTVHQQPLGLLTAHPANIRDGHTQLAIATDSWENLPFGAVDLFISYLFKHWPLRKIYIDLLDAQYDRFASCADADTMRIEGRRLNHRFLDGQFLDLVTVAIDSAIWTRL